MQLAVQPKMMVDVWSSCMGQTDTTTEKSPIKGKKGCMGTRCGAPIAIVLEELWVSCFHKNLYRLRIHNYNLVITSTQIPRKAEIFLWFTSHPFLFFALSWALQIFSTFSQRLIFQFPLPVSYSGICKPFP